MHSAFLNFLVRVKFVEHARAGSYRSDPPRRPRLPSRSQAAMLMWTAGTLGAMVGTLVWPYRTGSAMIITEQVANAVLL